MENNSAVSEGGWAKEALCDIKNLNSRSRNCELFVKKAPESSDQHMLMPFLLVAAKGRLQNHIVEYTTHIGCRMEKLIASMDQETLIAC